LSIFSFLVTSRDVMAESRVELQEKNPVTGSSEVPRTLRAVGAPQVPSGRLMVVLRYVERPVEPIPSLGTGGAADTTRYARIEEDCELVLLRTTRRASRRLLVLFLPAILRGCTKTRGRHDIPPRSRRHPPRR
jgi:hypothetical protein